MFAWGTVNFITAGLLAIIVFSVWQGSRRGATGSMRHLLHFLLEGLVIVLSLWISWLLADDLSRIVQAWLDKANIRWPERELKGWEQLYYTFVTSFRDFSFLRFCIVWIVSFWILRQLFGFVLRPFFRPARPSFYFWKPRRSRSWPNAVAGGMIGSLVGMGRALVVLLFLFLLVSLFPQSPLAGYVQESGLYRESSKRILQPVTGRFLEQQLPVFTRRLEKEFSLILQRKYEVIDSRIPDHIGEAAREITHGLQTDEEKARALYDWVGSRIRYDWEKVRLYEEERLWKEQTPEDTFATRLGVCIDYARLYAVMARAVGLEARVVTGLGYDGRGGFGPHAWNEVYISETGTWIPLDATWAANGGNWFNPPDFHATHIPNRLESGLHDSQAEHGEI